MKFSRHSASALNWLSDFYHECGYGGTFDCSDEVYFVTENSHVLGVVRIANEHGFFVLRGMQILPQMRGQKIGQQLLIYLANQIESNISPLYCLPHQHLNSFYSHIGFKSADQNLAPAFLTKRMEYYLNCGHKISLLIRH